MIPVGVVCGLLRQVGEGVFADGLRSCSNAFLTGSGTIDGPVFNEGRIVAELKSNLYFEAKTFDPTGTAVSVYSFTTTDRIFFCLSVSI